MKYYIQISMWMIQLLGLNIQPINTIYKYTDGINTVRVIPINYCDSIGLSGLVDSSRQYSIRFVRDTEKINIVYLNDSEIIK